MAGLKSQSVSGWRCGLHRLDGGWNSEWQWRTPKSRSVRSRRRRRWRRWRVGQKFVGNDRAQLFLQVNSQLASDQLVTSVGTFSSYSPTFTFPPHSPLSSEQFVLEIDSQSTKVRIQLSLGRWKLGYWGALYKESEQDFPRIKFVPSSANQQPNKCIYGVAQ